MWVQNVVGVWLVHPHAHVAARELWLTATAQPHERGWDGRSLAQDNSKSKIQSTVSTE